MSAAYVCSVIGTEIPDRGRMGERCQEPCDLVAWRSGDLWVLDGAERAVWSLARPRSPFLLACLAGANGAGPGLPAATSLVPLVAGDGVYLLDPTGRIVWSFAAGWLLGEFVVPRSAVHLEDGSLVLGHVDRSEVVGGGLLRMFPGGGVDWLWHPGPAQLMEPASLRRTRRGTLLVADPQLHTITEIDLSGEILWRYGDPGRPGDGEGLLRAPMDCRSTLSGVLVVDAMNQRVIELGRGGEVLWAFGEPHSNPQAPIGSVLRDPRSAVRLANGETLIADTGNARVLRIGQSERSTVWGSKAPVRRLLCHPRSIEIGEGGNWWVADTNHHRVVEVDGEGMVRRQLGDGRAGGGKRLHWPRCARMDARRGLVVADGMNQRVVCFDPDGSVRREVRRLYDPRRLAEVAFVDPHDVQPLPGGHILCTDSGGNFVVELDERDQVVWSYGLPGAPGEGDLNDPHMALRIADGTTWIVDSLNHRVLRVDPRGDVLETITRLQTPDGERSLYYPRTVEPHGGGWLLVDGTGQLLLVDRHGALVQAIGPSFAGDGWPIRLTEPPRAVKSLAQDRLAVSDYSGGRILLLAYCGVEGAERCRNR